MRVRIRARLRVGLGLDHMRLARLERAAEREAEHVEVCAGAVQAVVDDDVERLAAKRAVERVETRRY